MTAEQERDLGRRIVEAEGRAAAALAGISSGRKRKGSERTRAGDIDRLTSAARELQASGNEADRARAQTALHHLRQAETLRWELAMSGVAIARGEARKLRSGYLDGADLQQEGFIGLLRAASRFDPERDIRFGTYARWWVRAQMTRAIDTHGRVVRLPGCAVEQLRILRKVMVDRAGEGLTLAQTAEHAGLDLERADELLTLGHTVPLDAPMGDDPEGRSWANILTDDDAADPFVQAELGEEVARMLEALHEVVDERKRAVLILRFGLHNGEFLSLTEIGRRLGLSRERVRQLERDALVALRQAMRELTSTASAPPARDPAAAQPSAH